LAEEIYQNIPFCFGFASRKSIHLVDFSLSFPFLVNYQEKKKLITEFLLPLRQDLFSLLEKARQEKIIATNSQASCLIYSKQREKYDLSSFNLTELLMIAEIKFSKCLEKNMITGSFCSFLIEKSELKRCLRCWNWRKLKNDICLRCQTVLLA